MKIVFDTENETEYGIRNMCIVEKCSLNKEWFPGYCTLENISVFDCPSKQYERACRMLVEKKKIEKKGRTPPLKERKTEKKKEKMIMVFAEEGEEQHRKRR